MAIPLPPLRQPPRPAPRPVDAVLRLFPILHVLSGAVLLFSPAFFVPLAFSLALADGELADEPQVAGEHVGEGGPQV